MDRLDAALYRFLGSSSNDEGNSYPGWATHLHTAILVLGADVDLLQNGLETLDKRLEDLGRLRDEERQQQGLALTKWHVWLAIAGVVISISLGVANLLWSR